MKKIDVEKDLKRTKFLIKAMVAQIVIVLVIMFAYWAYLKSERCFGDLWTKKMP
jgi:hypothetical protein